MLNIRPADSLKYDLINRFRSWIGQPNRSADVRHVLTHRVDTQGLADRGDEVRYGDRPIFDFQPVVACLTNDLPAFHSATGQDR